MGGKEPSDLFSRPGRNLSHLALHWRGYDKEIGVQTNNHTCMHNYSIMIILSNKIIAPNDGLKIIELLEP